MTVGVMIIVTALERMTTKQFCQIEHEGVIKTQSSIQY